MLSCRGGTAGAAQSEAERGVEAIPAHWGNPFDVDSANKTKGQGISLKLNFDVSCIVPLMREWSSLAVHSRPEN